MTDTKLKQIGPDIGQLSQNLSFTEKTQIGAIRNTGVSISAIPGRLNGNTTKALQNVTNTAKSMMEIGGELAAKMESVGAVRKNTQQFIGQKVPKSVEEKRALYRKDEEARSDLTNAKFRPSNRRKSITEIIKRNKGDIAGLILEELGLLDLGYAGLQFPYDLDKKAPVWITLKIMKYDRGDPRAEGSMSKIAEIHLPLPENFSFVSNMRIQEADTGTLAGDFMRSEQGQTFINKMSEEGMGAAFNAALDQFKTTTGSEVAGYASQVAQRAAFAALDAVDPAAGGLAGQAKGAVPNPHPTAFFKGVELRQFQWNWKLVPRNKKDSVSIQAIIRLLREAAIPRGVDGIFMDYPFFIQPVVHPDSGVYGEFKRSLISQLSINFSGEGTSAFFTDGSPVSVNLGLNFTEVENYSPSSS